MMSVDEAHSFHNDFSFFVCVSRWLPSLPFHSRPRSNATLLTQTFVSLSLFQRSPSLMVILDRSSLHPLSLFILFPDFC